MAVLALEVQSRAPYQDGQPFGEAGAYERIDGVLRFAVDPDHVANAGIVDLHLAPRDPAGRVRFAADFCLLQPADPARGSGRLLFDVLNRGRKTVQGQFNRAPRELVPTERIDPGDGFLLTRGWAVAWCGWQWDVPRPGPLLGLEAPEALRDGRPVQGQVQVSIQPVAAARDALLADRIHQPYPAVDREEPSAALYVRDYPGAARVLIPRERWRFARDVDGRPEPDATRVWLADGFDAGRIYEVVYTTSHCPVAGTGLLAVRDCVSFLRYAGANQGNPSAGAVRYAYAFGASQSGRFLREYLHLGINLDEDGRPVLDGVMPHIAGARRGEFNQRFAQPSVQYTPGFGHLPPFAADAPEGGLLDRQRARGGVPKIMFVNTAAEYWRGDAALLHITPDGACDIEPAPDVRIYHLAGTQHTSGVVPLIDRSPLDGSRGAHPFNCVDYSMAMRALLEALDGWVTAGAEPPPSAAPRLDDGTAVPRDVVLATFARFPAVTVPEAGRLRRVPRLDLGPDAVAGTGRFPAVESDPYPCLVPAVDEDGNEVAGIRLPEVSVPLATVTGWNPRHPEIGGPGQIMDMTGSTLPLARDPAERARRGDPRRSIAERYASRSAYLAQVRAAADALVAQRYLLASDVDLAVQLAERRWEALAGAVVAAG